MASKEEPAWLEALRRNSHIGLTAEGRFTFHGQPLQNERVEALFHRSLSMRDDGEVILTVGAQWCYVDADDVPFFVLGLSGAGPDAFGVVRVNTGEEEPFAPEGLVWQGEHRVYYHLADGRRARLLRQAVQDLGALLDPDDDAQHGVCVACGGQRIPLRVEAPWTEE